MVAVQKDAGRRKEKTKPLLEAINTEGDNGNSSFARALGSTDYMTREKGVQALTRWLQLKADVPDSDMLKLWKGLYFCFWHSDKTPVQTELAERLAAIMGMLTEEAAFRYWSVFITTMRREWFSIDRLRLDKFLMLIRKFTHAMFLHLRQHKWRTDLVARYMEVVRSIVLLQSDHQQATGFAYHVCDIYLPELRAAIAAPASSKQHKAGSLTEPALRALLEPFSTTLARTGEQAMVTRVRESVFEELIEELENEGRGQEEDEEGARPVPLLSMLSIPEVAEQLFDAGAQPEVKARNRTALYEISQQLDKLLPKKRKLSGAAGLSEVNGTLRQPLTDTAQQQQVPASAGKKGMADKRQHVEGLENGSVLFGNCVAGADHAGVGDETGTKGRKGKRKAPEAELAAQQGGEEAVPEDVPHVIATSGKRKGKGAQAEEAAAAPSVSSQAAQHGAGAPKQAVPPKSALKVKGAAVEGGAAPVAATTRVRIAQAPAEGAGAGPGSAAQAATGSGSKGAAANGKTPRTAQKEAAAAASSEKKSVRINLRKNLYFDFKGPLPDPDVRTPSRSKGGILKKNAVVGRFGIPKSAPAKMAGARPGAAGTPGSAGSINSVDTPSSAGSAGKRMTTPKTAPRARAALFF